MAKKRRSLEYENPVTTVELTNRLGGGAGRRLRTRIQESGQTSADAETQSLVEQATGFLAEVRQLSFEEAHDVLVQDACVRDLTMREAAERLLRHRDNAGGAPV